MQKKNSFRLLLLLALLAAIPGLAKNTAPQTSADTPEQKKTISSPDGNVTLTFFLNGKGTPTYQIDYKQAAVVRPSTLGLELNGKKPLLDGFQLKKASTSTFDETWQPVWGENSNIRNHYNELFVELEQPAEQRQMNLRFRVYDEGCLLYTSPSPRDCS